MGEEEEKEVGHGDSCFSGADGMVVLLTKNSSPRRDHVENDNPEFKSRVCRGLGFRFPSEMSSRGLELRTAVPRTRIFLGHQVSVCPQTTHCDSTPLPMTGAGTSACGANLDVFWRVSGSVLLEPKRKLERGLPSPHFWPLVLAM